MGLIIDPYRFAVAGGVGGWVELGRTTLGSSSATINVTSLPDKRYYMYLIHGFIGSRYIETRMRFNSDTGSNYAYRISQNGGADATGGSNSSMIIDGIQDTSPRLQMGFVANKSDKEKLLMGWSNIAATGAATAPGRNEQVHKWTNISSSINAFNITTSDPGSDNYGAGSEVVVLGWDPADTHTNNFWTELASVDLSGGASETLDSGTFTAKKYLWIQVYFKATGGTVEPDFQVNGLTTNIYANRYSINGGADSTYTSAPRILGSGVPQSAFFNIFIINNSANEKLIIMNEVYTAGLGAGNAPSRRETVAKVELTTAQITRILWTENSGGAGTFDTSSYMKVFGSD